MNLKAMAQDLMDRFVALESMQVPEVEDQADVEGASATSQAWSVKKHGRSVGWGGHMKQQLLLMQNTM